MAFKIDRSTKDALLKAMVDVRNANKVSQREMAKRLCKSVNTISNWENGIGEPSMSEFLDWHLALHVNPLRALLNTFYPETSSTLSGSLQETEIKNRLCEYIKNTASMDEVEKLSYSIFGETGSDWKAQLEMWTAQNHLSMKSRVFSASLILSEFQVEKARKEIVGSENIMPNELLLEESIRKATTSTVDNRNSYA